MRKTCKNHPKNEQKKHQKPSKNKPKKHNEKMTRQFQPKWDPRDQNTTDKGGKGRDPGWNPPRKKKEYCKNQTYCGERVHAGRKHADCDRSSTRSAAGRARPGGESYAESRLPAAIVPPPGLGKIVCMRKFARNLIPGSMQECFFTNFCLKN